jgi:hypothetical protein
MSSYFERRAAHYLDLPQLVVGRQFKRQVSSGQPKSALCCGRIEVTPVCATAKRSSGPAQEVEDDSNDENRSEYAAADNHVDLQWLKESLY